MIDLRRQACAPDRHAAMPHGWERATLRGERPRTLFCGDLFTHRGAEPALTDGDIVGPAMAAEEIFHSLAPDRAGRHPRLGNLEPRTWR